MTLRAPTEPRPSGLPPRPVSPVNAAPERLLPRAPAPTLSISCLPTLSPDFGVA